MVQSKKKFEFVPDRNFGVFTCPINCFTLENAMKAADNKHLDKGHVIVREERLMPKSGKVTMRYGVVCPCQLMKVLISAGKDPQHFHEVVHDDKQRKPAIDIDVDLEQYEMSEEQYLIMRDHFIDILVDIFPGLDLTTQLSVIESHSLYKWSLNLVVNGWWLRNHEESQLFRADVKQRLNFNYIPFFDENMYARNKNVRTIFSSKAEDRHRVKRMLWNYEYHGEEINCRLIDSWHDEDLQCWRVEEFWRCMITTSQDSVGKRLYEYQAKKARVMDEGEDMSLHSDYRADWKLVKRTGPFHIVQRLVDAPWLCPCHGRIHDNQRSAFLTYKGNKAHFHCYQE
jgi:hypothetical protein